MKTDLNVAKFVLPQTKPLVFILGLDCKVSFLTFTYIPFFGFAKKIFNKKKKTYKHYFQDY